MKIKEAVDLAKELVGISEEALAVQVIEVLNKHWDNEELTKGEMFLAGLRFYEFLALDTSDSGYAQALVKQQSAYKTIGLSEDFWKKVDALLAGG